MIDRIRARLTYSNVLATLAIFLAIGGGTFAIAALKKNSVGKKQLKKGAVVTKKVKDGAITEAKIAAGAIIGAKLADGAVTGAKADLSTFGQVPSAASADSALTLGGKTAAQLQTVSGFDQDETDVPMPVAFGVMNTVTVTTPSPSRVLASASLTILSDGAGADDFASCFIAIDGVPGATYSTQVPNAAVNGASLSAAFARQLEAGDHTVTLECRDSAASAATKGVSSLSVWTAGA